MSRISMFFTGPFPCPPMLQRYSIALSTFSFGTPVCLAMVSLPANSPCRSEYKNVTTSKLSRSERKANSFRTSSVSENHFSYPSASVGCGRNRKNSLSFTRLRKLALMLLTTALAVREIFSSEYGQSKYSLSLFAQAPISTHQTRRFTASTYLRQPSSCGVPFRTSSQIFPNLVTTCFSIETLRSCRPYR